MTKTLDAVVKVRRRFQRSVRVDTDIGAASLEGFVCPQSAADSLLGMARQIHEVGQGAFTWTGPYGCGKSSLAVAVAALLAEPSLKTLARSAMGQQVATELERLLDPDDLGWRILPVVGSRVDPSKAVGAALDKFLDVKRTRGRPNKTEADVIARLVELSARPDRAGLLVVIDEMGKFLEEAAFGGGADVYFFQQLAEAANRSAGRLVVVGVLHQSFDDYAHRLSREIRDEWLKIQGRFADVPINVAGEEQIELIARAIETDAAPGANKAQAEGVADAIRAQRPGTGGDLGVRLHECWPLHPVVASLLGPLSRRRFGQNQRSVFGFLNSAEPFGFQEYLKTEPARGAVAYDAVNLWDYLRTNLEPSILASPDGHRWSLAVDAVERSEARGAELDHLALVKTIALVDLFKERSGLLPSAEVLRHALPHLGASRLESCLEDLKAWSVVLYRRHLGSYAIYAGSDFDIDAAVSEARTRLPMVDLARLRSLALLQPVLAKRHYHTTGALRWFEVDIAALSDGTERVRQFRPQHGATGLFLLLIGTEAESDAKAKKLWRTATEAADGWPVAIGWTRDSFMIRELASELLALEAVRSERSELQGDAVARREVSARIARLSAEVEDRLNHAFDEAQWAWRAGNESDLSTSDGTVTLNAIASALADERYRCGPKIKNELLNRIKPSSNAIAAQKELLKAMVERWQEPRLGIEGYPATGGLYDSLLGATGLHAPRADDSRRYAFVDPAAASDCRLAPLWQVAEAHFREAGSAGADLATLYAEWRKPPFGVRDGLLPVFAVAYLMSRSGRLAVYLDGAFQPKVSAILIDRLAQDPASVRLRWTEASDFHIHVLGGVADLVAGFGAIPAGQTHPETIDVARGLVGLVLGLPAWVLRTGRLSTTAAKVRNLAKLASDPNKFLLDDLPSVFADGMEQTRDVAETVVATLRDGLRELIEAYPAMLRELRHAMLRELRVEEPTAAALATLHGRAEAIKGLTGNYRLDAFATRLATYTGEDEEMEGLASLAANKPPRDWADRDIDHARVEIAALAQEFVRAEAFAHVKGRDDGRVKMAIFISDPNRPSPVKPDFDIGISQQHEARMLADQLEQVLADAKVGRNVALAALAELGARLSEADPQPVLPFDPPPQPLPFVRRKGAAR
ncbi:ATP-binding protein [Aminobacter sp. Piv2-1]|uniref:ATP-binding protein n=1 Tax=Aminobacter sp. Piv2-1 TaxID=3031122 RepID=UPI0030B56FF5